MVPLWIILISLAIYWLKKNSINLDNWLNGLLIFSVTALIFPFYTISNYQIQLGAYENQNPNPIQENNNLKLPINDPPPDIYYIILDAYARHDAILDDFDYDNTPFLNNLTDLGFYVASCSRSNYPRTRLSLSSSLNMGHVDTLVDFKNTDDFKYSNWIEDNLVRQLLESLGYTSIGFETGYIWTEWQNADIYLSASQGAIGPQRLAKSLNNFEILLMESTLAQSIMDLSAFIVQPNLVPIDQGEELHRQRMAFILDQMDTIENINGPKFVFAHIVVPHAPFVFAQDGSNLDISLTEPEAYVEQIIYINSRIEKIANQIITNSETPPIIIVQGDHGGPKTSPENRMKILNAFYLPEGESILYPNITPVNSFRVIFNHYFQGDFELQPDISYSLNLTDLQESKEVEENNPTCLP